MIHPRIIALVLALTVSDGLNAQSPRPRRYAVKPLPSLGGGDCKAMALNHVAQIVGSYRSVDRLRSVTTRMAFLFEQERLWQLPMGGLSLSGNLGGTGPPSESRAVDVNDGGIAVGWVRRAAPKAQLAWEAVSWDWKRQTMSRVPIGAGQNSFAYGVNLHGDIVGTYENAKGDTRAFLWPAAKPERIVDLGTLGGSIASASAINDHQQITGASTTREGAQRAFIHTDGKLKTIGTLGGPISQGNAINSNGAVAGVSQTRTGQFHAFLFQDGKLFDLGTLGGNFSYASGIYGTMVVGKAEDKGLVARAFLFDGKRMWDLNQFLPRAGDWFLTEALDVNSKGQILCMARSSSGRLHPVLLLPI